MLLGLMISLAVPILADTNNNDSCANAEVVALDYSGSGNLSGSSAGNDVNDYYSFTVAAAGTFTISTSGAIRDVDGYLYNSGCTTTYTSDTSNSNNVSISYHVNSGQTLKLRLNYQGNSNRTTVYNLTINFVRDSLSEINVVGVADGGTDATFGSVLASGGTIDRTYTIQNTGTEALTVGSVTVSGANSGDFTIISQPAASVAAGGTTTFTVRFDPSGMGTRTATLSFSNNDMDENPYNFSISGTGDGPPIMGNIPNQVFAKNMPVDFDLSAYVTLTNNDPILFYTLTGTLPAGLSFDTATGKISGTPTDFTSASNFTIKATDEDGDSNIVSFTITVSTAFSGLHSFDKINPANTYNVRGNYAIAGNTVMCLTELTSGYGGTCHGQNDYQLITSNNHVSKYIDIDGDSSTWNSTSSYVVLPATYDNSPSRGILWAGLFWQGRISNDNDYDKRYAKESGSSYTYITTRGIANIDFPNTGAETIKLKVDSGAYQDATASTVYKNEADGDVTYAAFADVTDIVQSGITASGKHTFTVANLTTNEGREGNPGLFGGWSLVVIYAENANGKTRNISVYSGFDEVGQPSPAFKITDFKLPTSDLVHATLSLFSGEGEYLYGYRTGNTDKYDWVKVSNDGINYQYMPGATTNENIFDAVFDGILRDDITGFSNNLQVNNDGVDIDNYDVSALMTTYRDANPDMHEMYIQWSSNEDYITPSMITFATELYAPKLCYDYSYKQDGHYLKADNDGSQLPKLNGTISDSQLDVSVYIRNIESDIAASNVSFYTTDVNSTLFRYVDNSIASSNVNGSVLIPRDDTGTGCDYHDSATTPIGCVNASNVRIGLGDGATGYSINGAGNFGSQAFAYAKFGLKPRFSGIRDVNESLGLSVDYTIRPDGVNTDIEYNYVLGVNMDMCPASSGYSPTWGTFNVVDRNAGSYASHGQTLPTNNLLTQVSRKQFDVNIAAYGKYTDNTYTIRPTADINTTVVVEMIDNDAFHDINASCANPDSNVSQAIFVPLQVKNGVSTAALIPTQEVPYYNFAVKNAAFRIWYFNDKSGALIPNWTAATSDAYRLNLQSISGLYKNDTHTLCSASDKCGATNNGTQASTSACFACIKENYALPLCSRDNFAVRPESYDLRIYDVNQSLDQNSSLKNATKINLSSQYHYTPEYSSATGRINIAAGYNYRYDMNATGNDTNLAKVPGYTRYFNGASNDYNATMIWEPDSGHITTGCNDRTGKTLSLYVANGQMLNTEQNQTQVGEYRLNIIDPAWTAVDWEPNFLTHHTTGFLSGSDCNDASDSTDKDSTTGKVGCITTSAHSGGGYTYKDHLLRLKPAKFDLSGIAYGLGKIPLGITTGGVGFVYDSDLNVTNDMAMSVSTYGPLKAVGYGGEALSNFVTQCYATDLNVSISHDANMSIPFSGRMTVAETNGTQIFDSLEFNAKKIASQTIDDTYFHKANSGQTSPTIRLNVDRNSTTPILPQIVHYGDLNVSCSIPSDCNMSAMSNSTPNTAKGYKVMDFSVTHAYGRLIARDIKATWMQPFNELAKYEVYKTSNLIGTPLSLDQFDADWYVNVLHTDANYGDASVTVIDPSNGASLPTESNSLNGVETFIFPAFTVRQGYRGHIDTEGWLWYGGINALPYADPNGPAQAGADNLSCLTHPCFGISLGRIIGNTGSAKKASELNKANKKTTSTGWSTTSEYAPAVR